jgi:serine/threonine protein kinase
MVSIHGDIYSYGVLILEMVTGRRPTDNEVEHGLSLRNYVEMAIDNRVMDIINMELVTELENENARVDGAPTRKRLALVSLLKLGILCTDETPSTRMSTKDIIKELHEINKALV